MAVSPPPARKASPSTLVAPLFSAEFASLKDEIIRQRTEYEVVIDKVIAELDLEEGVDRKLLRLQFLGALNWSQTWYRPGGKLTAAEVGAHLVRLLKGSVTTPQTADCVQR